MERPQYLIDSNVVIDYLAGNLSSKGTDFLNYVIDAIPNVSVITKIEVLGFNVPKPLDKIIVSFIDDSSVLDLTSNIVEVCIEIRKKFKIKLPDAIIASTAIVNNLKLITRNDSDFKGIMDLVVINPYKML